MPRIGEIGVFLKSVAMVEIMERFNDPTFGPMLTVKRMDNGKELAIPQDTFVDKATWRKAVGD